MATRPRRNPLTEIPRARFFDLGYAKSTGTNPAAHAANVVLAATGPMPSQSMAERVEPGLKPYQPNHRMTPPMAPRLMSWGGVGPPPSRLNLRPMRGPGAMQPARAMKPPTVGPTAEPAKSRNNGPQVRPRNH